METLKGLVNRFGESAMENDDGTLSGPKMTAMWALSGGKAGKYIHMG